MTRKEANLEILRRIKHYITMYPDIRFGQALRNLGVIVDFLDDTNDIVQWANHFYEEPTNMLERMKKQKMEGK